MKVYREGYKCCNILLFCYFVLGQSLLWANSHMGREGIHNFSFILTVFGLCSPTGTPYHTKCHFCWASSTRKHYSLRYIKNASTCACLQGWICKFLNKTNLDKQKYFFLICWGLNIAPINLSYRLFWYRFLNLHWNYFKILGSKISKREKNFNSCSYKESKLA